MSSGSGYSVVPVQRVFLPLRIVQMVFAVVVFGIAAYHLSLLASYDVSTGPRCEKLAATDVSDISLKGRWTEFVHRSRNRDLLDLLVRRQQPHQLQSLQLLGIIRGRALCSHLLALFLRSDGRQSCIDQPSFKL